MERALQMDCERCTAFRLRLLTITEEYIALVERQSQFFRDGDPQAGRRLDDAIAKVKADREEAVKEADEHRASHQ